MSKKIVNLGILAHVDAGKTTITEQLLYHSGAIKESGSVDKGNSTTDRLAIEKERGISVKSANACFEFDNVFYNIIDTPGHSDFVSEVERSLKVLDAAILVISSVEGIQSHTNLLWEALKNLSIPTLIFVNKVDRAGSDFDSILKNLKTDLGINQLLLNSPENEAEKNVSIIDFNSAAFSSLLNEINIENIAEQNDQIMEQYLDGIKITPDEYIVAAKKLFLQKKITPTLCGSAKLDIGVNNLLKQISNFIPHPVFDQKKAPSAIVYKIEHDAKLGKLVHIKLLSGLIVVKETLYNHRLDKDIKVAQLKKQLNLKIQDIDKLEAGDVGILVGAGECQLDDRLGHFEEDIEKIKLQEAILSTQIKTTEESQYPALAVALQELNIEDPDLNFKWYKEGNELQLNLHGPIQKEILKDIIASRYKINVAFDNPSIIYKETPKKKAQGFVRYWMPKPCWAIMRFEIEPLERGSGVIYESKVGVNDIHQKYQNEVKNTIKRSLEQGIKGWEVTDIKITLIEGEDHQIHSRPGDFVLATPMGIMDALKNSDTQLLEPMLRFEIQAHESLLGAINSDLLMMRADIEQPGFKDESFILKGRVPVSTSLDYSIKLNSVSSGKAKYLINFDGYRECTDEDGIIRAFKGVSPLDESLWILHNRGAYK